MVILLIVQKIRRMLEIMFSELKKKRIVRLIKYLGNFKLVSLKYNECSYEENIAGKGVTNWIIDQIRQWFIVTYRCPCGQLPRQWLPYLACFVHSTNSVQQALPLISHNCFFRVREPLPVISSIRYLMCRATMAVLNKI